MFEAPPVDPFAGLVEGTPEAAPVTNPEVARRTAQMAALADLNVSEQAGAIFDTWAQRTEIYETQIKELGDRGVREEAAAAAQERRLGAIAGVLEENLQGTDPSLTEGAVLAYQEVAAADTQEDARYALEQRAVENIQNLAAQGDITQARVMLGNLERGNALDVIRDHNAKQMILRNMIDKASADVQDNNWLENAADFLLGFLPLNASLSNTGNVDVADGLKNWYDGILSGERLRNEADSLWDMDIKEFSKFVNEDFIKNIDENATLFGYRNDTEALNLLTQLGDRTDAAWITNTFNALDNIGLAAPLIKPVRGAMGMAGTMVKNGARREAVQATTKTALDIINDSTEAAAKSTSVMTVDETAAALSVRAVSPEPADIRVGIATDADRALEEGRALLAARPELESQARLGQAEFDKAVATITGRLEDKYAREIKDVDSTNKVTLSSGSVVNRIQFSLGKKDGGGFANEAQANRYLGSIGEVGEAVLDSSGQWFARLTIDMPETGFYTRLVNVKTPSPMRFLLNARNVGDALLADAAQVAGNAQNKILKTLVEPYSNIFRALGGAERVAMSQVLQAGESLGKWFDPEQLGALYQRQYNRAPSVRELAAYNAAREINNIEFVLRNDEIYKQKVLRGYQTATFDTGLGRVDAANALVDLEMKSIPSGRMFDVSTKKHYVDETRMTPKMWERMKSQGYRVVTLETALKMADGTTVKTFLVKGQDINIENLARNQVSYRAGGHRMYKGKYFVKQTVRGRQPDTGKEFLENPNTYIAAETRAEADFFSRRMEAARVALVNGEDAAVIDEILGGHAGLPSADEFIRITNDPNGAFQKDTKFGTYADREMPEEYMQGGDVLQYVEEETGFNGFLRTNGRMYTGRKGEQLRDFRGDEAPLLDPFEVINKSLMNISSMTSFSDYKIQAVERWVNTFGRILDKTGMEDASAMRLFMEAPLKAGGNLDTDRIRSAALAQKQIIKRTLSWKTDNDLRSEAYGRRMQDFVAGKRVDGIIPEARKSLANWWEDANPVAALRSFAFDLKLGMFNVAQLPLQLSTAVAATALDPVNGMKGWAMIAPMRFMLGTKQLSKEAFEARLEQLVKNGTPALGGFKDAAEFKDFTRSVARSGFFDVGGTHGLMDSYGPPAALDGFASGVDRVRDAGRFFFFEAERWNRIVAWRIAWNEAQESGLKAGTAEFSAKLAGRAEEYAFNMSRESQAWWQKGLLSVPTQFWAYNARMLEAMTVGNFTPAQKLRLFVSQSLLYGSAGVPLGGFVSAKLKAAQGESPDIDTLPGTIDRGLLDRFIYEMTGADVLAGQRLGTGGFLPQIVEDLFGSSQYGPTSAAELLGGATYSILGQVGETLKPIVEYVTAESGDEGRPFIGDAMMRMAKNISTVGNLTKAYMVYNYGIYQSNNGTTTVDGLPSGTAFAVALSLQPAELDELSAINSFRKNRSKHVEEAAKVISRYRTDMLNRPDQAETLAEEINIFVRLLPEDIRADALQRAQRNVDPSLYASMVEYMEKEKAKDGLTN